MDICLGRKKEYQATTREVNVIIEGKIPYKGPLPPLAIEFIINDKASQKSPFCTYSPVTFLESLGTRVVEATKFWALRLSEKSRKIKNIIKEFISKTYDFFNPMEKMAHGAIIERDWTLASLEWDWKDSKRYVNALREQGMPSKLKKRLL